MGACDAVEPVARVQGRHLVTATTGFPRSGMHIVRASVTYDRLTFLGERQHK